ncbi:hypothetical protein N5P18_06350 [Janibacter terrae]|uniref:Alkaline phosphatase family protein n=1 Tax=Janibacter terrae TaxID=103817 RepID=A0ABZ2FI72_9MICO
MLRLALLVLAGLVLLGAATPAQAADAPRDVVVIGAPGLSWSDITTKGAPAIHSFAGDAAVTNVNVRSTYFTSCPSDGWLGLSAGTRAAEPRDVTRGQLRAHPRALPRCSPLPSLPGPGSGPELVAVDMDREFWRGLSQGVAAQGFDARIGVLGQAVADAGGCIAGSGDGAVLAMPDLEGVIPHGEPGVHETCAITLVGAPAVTVPAAPRDLRRDEGASKVRADQVTAVDETVRDVLTTAHSDTVVLLAGLSDDGGQPGLRVLAMGGGGTEPGWLHSDSTTRDEMAQVADVTHTALAIAGITPPDGIAGRELVPVGDTGSFAERRARLVDDDTQLREADRVIPPFFRGFGVGLALLLVAAAVAWRFAPRARPVVTAVTGVVGLAAMALPVSTYLVTRTRWFATDEPFAGFVARVVVIDLVVVALTLLGMLLGRRRAPDSPFAPALVPVGVVAGLTWLVLAGDLLLGSGRMTMLSVLGLLPLDGGRFHGFGNVPFAIFVASAFLLVTALVSPLLAAGRRRAAVGVVLVLGGATFLVDAWLGADGGGALALIPSVVYLVLAVAGVRLTWARVLGIGVVTAVGFLAMAGADWLRPEEQRTHLGRFFGTLLDGDAWAIIVRKLETNVDLLLGPERAALLVPVVLVAVIWVLARPDSALGRRVSPLLDAHAGLRIGLTALVVALTVGFLLNDSGTAIPAAAALVLAPALVVLVVGTQPASTRGRAAASRG